MTLERVGEMSRVVAWATLRRAFSLRVRHLECHSEAQRSPNWGSMCPRGITRSIPSPSSLGPLAPARPQRTHRPTRGHLPSPIFSHTHCGSQGPPQGAPRCRDAGLQASALSRGRVWGHPCPHHNSPCPLISHLFFSIFFLLKGGFWGDK